MVDPSDAVLSKTGVLTLAVEKVDQIIPFDVFRNISREGFWSREPADHDSSEPGREWARSVIRFDLAGSPRLYLGRTTLFRDPE